MPSSPLFPASNIFVFRDGDDPDLMDPAMLLTMTGPQLDAWQQTFRPFEPVFSIQNGSRPVEDNEGADDAQRAAIAAELRAAGIHQLPPRWVKSAPVPTAKQFLQNLYFTKPFGGPRP
jgi:hypothetical protein